MRLEGSVFQDDRRLRMATTDVIELSESLSMNLDRALLRLCKDLNIPIPLWLKKNTREFARFRHTVFSSDHFTEKIDFTSFALKLIED